LNRRRLAAARSFAASPWWGGPRLALALLSIILVGGVAGYMVIEGWSLWDAVYMTVITVTTVGYKEVHPMSRAGEGFTVLLLMTGVATFLYTFTIVMARVVEGGLQERWVKRRQSRMLDELEHHFIVCGFGRMGHIIAREFEREKIPFVLIERDPARLQEAVDMGYIAVEADASSEVVLRRIRIDRARGFIAAVSTDAENVYAVLTARLLRPDLYIIGRAETDDAKAKLVKAGADRVISPYHIGGLHLAQTALRPAVVDFVQLATSSENLDLAMEQIRVEERSPLAGRTLLQANLRQKYSVIVVGIKHADGKMEFNPAPDAAMRGGDDIVVLGRPEDLRDLEATAGAGAPSLSER
jgi:voltage-gated potassium channel